MDNQTIATAKTTTNKVETPKTVEVLYQISVNKRGGGYNSLPKSDRVYKGRISSEYRVIDGISTGAIIRGLTTSQERLYASQLINKNPKDMGYDEAMTIYWADFTVDIPEAGIALDASYRIEKRKIDEIEEQIEIPLNLFSYMKAKFAMQSSRVAKNELEFANSELFDFKIIDLSITKKVALDQFKLQNEADSKYMELVKGYTDGQTAEKIDYLLDTLKNPTEHFYSKSIEDKMMRLKEICQAKPELFKAAFDNAHLATESLIYRLVQTKLVIKEGDLYFIDDKSFTYKEAIKYLEDQINSASVAKLKAQLKEAMFSKV